MSDVETARTGLEHAHHTSQHKAGGHTADALTRNTSLLIGALAAALALGEMQERSSQTEYLTEHIAISDDWAFFGFKGTRARVADQSALVLRALPQTADTQKAIADTEAYAQRQREGDASGEGTRQIEARIHERTHLRDEALHHYERWEAVNGVLQIAVVLASVAIVTGLPLLAWSGAVLGGLAVLFGVLVRAGLV